jgi:UDP-N-acetylmuramoylalanine--D-glutamate ligase
MSFQNKRVLVVGMARSGIAAARFLADAGAMVTLYDKKPPEKLAKELALLRGYQIAYCLGEEPKISKEDFDLVVTSPGVPLNVSLLQEAKQQEIPLWGELELAYRVCKAPIIAITGTNGKSTTTTLLGKVLRDGGYQVKVAGNIGQPLIAETATIDEQGLVVAEVSSFQLETIHTFKPKVAVLINITPDHLDRHKTMEHYTYLKTRVFANQGPEDYAILNYDDPIVRQLAPKLQSKVIFFSKEHRLEQAVFFDGKVIKHSLQGKVEDIVCWDSIKLRGGHNLENCMAASAAALALGVSNTGLKKSLQDFEGIPHRLEVIGEVGGVSYVNDSKATNIESTLKALEAYADKPIVLIAGGLDRGNSFDRLAAYLTKLQVKVVLLGESAFKIESSLKRYGINQYYHVKNLEEAVIKSHEIANKGGVVLLSPACASWDMYHSFEERGDHFCTAVKKIMG